MGEKVILKTLTLVQLNLNHPYHIIEPYHKVRVFGSL